MLGNWQFESPVSTRMLEFLLDGELAPRAALNFLVISLCMFTPAREPDIVLWEIDQSKWEMFALPCSEFKNSS